MTNSIHDIFGGRWSFHIAISAWQQTHQVVMIPKLMNPNNTDRQNYTAFLVPATGHPPLNGHLQHELFGVRTLRYTQ